jgi:hypothetical protein
MPVDEYVFSVSIFSDSEAPLQGHIQEFVQEGRGGANPFKIWTNVLASYSLMRIWLKIVKFYNLNCWMLTVLMSIF